MNVKISNVVIQCKLSTELNLYQLAKQLTNVIYNPGKFSALMYRSRKCLGSCLIFKNGKFIVLGARSIHEATINCRRYMRIIQKICGHGDIEYTPKIVTMTAVYDTGYPLNLNLLYTALKGESSLEAEIFGALFHKSVKLKCHLSIFQSGKVTITGLKSGRHLQYCCRSIERKFRKLSRRAT
jgi:TATA-box binding protein (TBP) (component of TFIID and TFIIIB)